MIYENARIPRDELKYVEKVFVLAGDIYCVMHCVLAQKFNRISPQIEVDDGNYYSNPIKCRIYKRCNTDDYYVIESDDIINGSFCAKAIKDGDSYYTSLKKYLLVPLCWG